MSESSSGKAAAEQDAMDELCRAIGELVLWTSIIDGQLSTATSLMFIKDETSTAELLIGEIEFRRKAELLKTRAKAITGADDWKKAIGDWVRDAEKVNGARNIVAHQRPTNRTGGLKLQSHQLTRILKDDASDPVNIRWVLRWIEKAKTCQERGSVVLKNLERFAQEWRKLREAPTKSKERASRDS